MGEVMTFPLVGEFIECRLGFAQVKATVDGVYPVSCTHGADCWVIEATSLRGNPVVVYEHERRFD